MKTTVVTDGVYRLSANVSSDILFEGMWPLPYGMSMNSYIVKGKESAIIDGVCDWDGVPETLFAQLDTIPILQTLVAASNWLAIDIGAIAASHIGDKALVCAANDFCMLPRDSWIRYSQMAVSASRSNSTRWSLVSYLVMLVLCGPTATVTRPSRHMTLIAICWGRLGQWQ